MLFSSFELLCAHAEIKGVKPLRDRSLTLDNLIKILRIIKQGQAIEPGDEIFARILAWIDLVKPVISYKCIERRYGSADKSERNVRGSGRCIVYKPSRASSNVTSEPDLAKYLIKWAPLRLLIRLSVEKSPLDINYVVEKLGPQMQEVYYNFISTLLFYYNYNLREAGFTGKKIEKIKKEYGARAKQVLRLLQDYCNEMKNYMKSKRFSILRVLELNHKLKSSLYKDMCPLKPFNKPIAGLLISLCNEVAQYITQLSYDERSIYCIKSCVGFSTIPFAIADLAQMAEELVVICPFIDSDILVSLVIPNLIMTRKRAILVVITREERLNELREKVEELSQKKDVYEIEWRNNKLTIEVRVQKGLHAKLLLGYYRGKPIGLVEMTANLTKRSILVNLETGTYYREPAIIPDHKIHFIENLVEISSST